jgi:hypothetical protein
MACAILHSFPIWSCSVWGLPCLEHYCASGALLPHLFTLTAAAEHLRLRRLAPALPSHPAQSGSAFAVHSASTQGLRRLAPALPSRPAQARQLSPFTYPRRYILCGTFRKVALKPPSRTLSGTLLCGVRTFLSLGRAARESPASATQTATARSDINYPYYKMNSGGQGFTPWSYRPDSQISPRRHNR